MSIHEIRQAIIEALPKETSTHGQVPDKKAVYVPPSHIRALRLECNLVIGARGVGKTFWSAALRSEKIRELLGNSVPDLSKTDVYIGFGENPLMDAYPDSDVFDRLLKQSEPVLIWRAVLARWVCALLGEQIPMESWDATVDWVKGEPELFGRLLERANQKFEQEERIGLIVFDALDRSGANWTSMDDIVRGLLRVILSLKRFPRLHGKVFLREDQFSGRQISDFPDASKILSSRLELTWGPTDLHGLLWQYLCNAPSQQGSILRDIYSRIAGSLKSDKDIWTLPDPVKRDPAIQKELFNQLAGEWMGKDRRRGYPYTWTVGHLADGKGRTSPRSFLAAIRLAAEDTLEKYSSHSLPLHYESIKRGVQAASEIRVSELAEDYPWVKSLMSPLRGMTVPCTYEQAESRWLEKIGVHPIVLPFERLPPEHYEEGWQGIRKDLEKLGIFAPMTGGRINMPDLYRVGFGLGRKGGVKPLINTSASDH